MMTNEEIALIEHLRHVARVDEVIEFHRDHGTIEDLLGDLLFELDENQLKELMETE